MTAAGSVHSSTRLEYARLTSFQSRSTIFNIETNLQFFRKYNNKFFKHILHINESLNSFAV